GELDAPDLILALDGGRSAQDAHRSNITERQFLAGGRVDHQAGDFFRRIAVRFTQPHDDRVLFELVLDYCRDFPAAEQGFNRVPDLAWVKAEARGPLPVNRNDDLGHAFELFQAQVNDPRHFFDDLFKLCSLASQ